MQRYSCFTWIYTSHRKEWIVFEWYLWPGLQTAWDTSLNIFTAFGNRPVSRHTALCWRYGKSAGFSLNQFDVYTWTPGWFVCTVISRPLTGSIKVATSLNGASSPLVGEVYYAHISNNISNNNVNVPQQCKNYDLHPVSRHRPSIIKYSNINAYHNSVNTWGILSPNREPLPRKSNKGADATSARVPRGIYILFPW